MGPHPKKLIVKTFAPAPSRYAEKIKAKIAADPKQSSPAAPTPAPHPPKPARSTATVISSPTVQKPKAVPAPKPVSPAFGAKPRLQTPEAIAWRKARLEALTWLREAYPALMGPPLPLPLRFGELVCPRAFAAGHAVSALKAALARHCRSVAYLEALAAPESMRHDLEGNPAEPVNPSRSTLPTAPMP